MTQLTNLWKFLVGKKTYIAAIALLVYALAQQDSEMVLVALTLLGMRKGMSDSIANVIKEIKNQ